MGENLTNKTDYEVSKNQAFRNKITYLSLVLAILIVFRHAVNIDTYKIESGLMYWAQKFVSQFTDIIVPTFFMLSGFLFYINYNEKMLLKKWKTRFFSLVIPYFIWNLVAYLFYVVVYSIPFIADKMNQGVEPLTFKSIIINILLGDYNALWFVRVLIVYTFIFPLLYKYVLKYKIGFIILLLVLVALNFIFPSDYTMYSSIYGLGAFMGVHYKGLFTKRYNLVCKIIALCLILASVIFGLYLKGNWEWFYIFVRAFQGCLIWILADIFVTNKKPKAWMTISFFIYCTHSMILESIQKIFFILLPHNTLFIILDFILSPIITVLIIILLSHIIKKLPKVWKVLSGGR